MSQTVEDLTIAYHEDGIDVVKELDRVILSKGAWCTILYRYQEWNRNKQEYGPEKYSIRRYQKRAGEYRQQSRFNISSKAQAEAIVKALRQWTEGNGNDG